VFHQLQNYETAGYCTSILIGPAAIRVISNAAKSIRQEHKITEAAGIPINARKERGGSQIAVIEIFYASTDYFFPARNDKLN
jgi:hypothetical protein